MNSLLILFMVTITVFTTVSSHGNKRVIIRVPHRIRHIYHHSVKKVPVYVLLPGAKKPRVLEEFDEITKEPPPPAPPCKQELSLWSDKVSKYRYARHYSGERERERDRELDRERERDRELDRERERDRELDRERERDRELDRERERDREQDRERDRDREQDRERDREHEDYPHSWKEDSENKGAFIPDDNYSTVDQDFVPPPLDIPNLSFRKANSENFDPNYGKQVKHSLSYDSYFPIKQGISNDHEDQHQLMSNAIRITYAPSSLSTPLPLQRFEVNQQSKQGRYASSYQYKIEHGKDTASIL